MRLSQTCAAALTIFALGLSPALAEKGKGHGPGKGERHHGAVTWFCPPGLAKKDPACVPPGQAKKHADKKHAKAHEKDRKHAHHHHVIGDRLDHGDYILIRDPRRYGYDVRDGWSYYRDGQSVYRVDSNTRRVLAVLQLIEAFTN